MSKPSHVPRANQRRTRICDQLRAWARQVKVLCRVDASHTIGSGHVMRTLTLAEELRARECEVTFVCRTFPGNLAELIETRGFRVLRLAEVNSADLPLSLHHSAWLGVNQRQDAAESSELAGRGWDLLIVDHYGIDAVWENQMRQNAKKILVIDDVADRDHDCDFLLDQNFYPSPESRYSGKVPHACEMLLGPQFALLRQEFREARLSLRKRDHTLRNLLIFYGGADPQNQTMVALKGIEGLPYSADIVVGPSNSNFSEIEEYCKHLPGKTVHRNLAGMAQIMEKADLCLGAGGSTTWERCAMGLPSLVTVLASNQLEMTEEAQKAGLHIILGHAGKVKSADFHGAIEKMSPDLMAQLSTTGMAMVDALGATRVADQILN